MSLGFDPRLPYLQGSVTVKTADGKDIEVFPKSLFENFYETFYQRWRELSDEMESLANNSSSYTDEQAQDAVGTILVDTATIDFTYADATPSITADVKDGSITYAKMQDVSAASKLIGRGSASGSGDPEEITLGTGLSMSGTTLSASSSGPTLGKVIGLRNALLTYRGEFNQVG